MEASNLIILDRDGVINEDSENFIRSPDDWCPIPGSLEAIARLCREDYQVVLITNQSGISRGYFTINTLNRIHQKMLDSLHKVGGEISAIFFCPHSEAENCDCRKPKSGMFLELSNRTKRSLDGVYAVGDSLRDLQAAKTAGAVPVLVKTGKGSLTLAELESGEYTSSLGNVPVHENLSSFVESLLSTELVT